jgi:hypothetical protein
VPWPILANLSKKQLTGFDADGFAVCAALIAINSGRTHHTVGTVDEDQGGARRDKINITITREPEHAQRGARVKRSRPFG